MSETKKKAMMLAALPLILSGALGGGIDAAKPSNPVACILPPEELRERYASVIATIREGVQSTRELPDGYEFTFPGTSEWVRTLMDFVAMERDCCTFFTLELRLEADHGPIHLTLRGREGVKAFISVMAGDALN